MEIGSKVLVVDDERTVCESVRKVLTRQGLPVDQAHSVEEGLSKIEQGGDYAAVIVDLVMPRAGGEELLKVVRGRNPETSVVVMTGYASIESAVRSTKLGAFDYLTKPFTPDELREVTKRAIQKHIEVQNPPEAAQKEPRPHNIDVDLPFDAAELEAQTSKQFAEATRRSDLPIGRRSLPESYCVKGEMVCKRFERQGRVCEGECPILTHNTPRAASQPRVSANAIDVDLPFSAEEVAEYTCPGYVHALGRLGMPMPTRWPEVDAEILRRVLVVDDEAVVCNSVRKILSRQGYQVDETDDGREALRRIEDTPYELIILDMVMPKMNGIDVLREIKERKPRANVVMITGYASIDSAKEAIRLGANDYLPKPFTPEELVRATQEAIAA
jgi:DNA-binding response OmpR family regulator